MASFRTHIILFQLFILSTSIAHVYGQDLVGNSAYNQVLQKLLAHRVTDIGVGDLDSLTNVGYLDARSKREYKVSHVKDAIWVGYDTYSSRKLKGLTVDSKIVVYCSVGLRSEKVAERLGDEGFGDVSNMYGGIFEWKNRDYELVDEDGVTDRVHVYNEKWGVWLDKGIKVYE